MLAHCFNPQLARGRVQSSNWQAAVNQNQACFKYSFYTVCNVWIKKKNSFNNDFIFQKFVCFFKGFMTSDWRPRNNDIDKIGRPPI